ncbi:molybdenum cofactor biosynthesis protein C, partial [Aulographum hederae CBS 113979]
STLTHLTPSGTAHMVPVNAKPATHRTAIAVATVRFSNAIPARQIRTNVAKKGDVLGVARIAGIQAAKMTPGLIPLCHPIMVTGVEVGVEVFGGKGEGEEEDEGGEGNDYGAVSITARVETVGPTGVEMEALTAASVAALTVVDMVKGVDRGVIIEGVRCVFKSGGRSG